MPRNVKGGNRAKKMASKHAAADAIKEVFRHKELTSDERYAFVTKVCGNNNFDVVACDGKQYKCIVSRKFRGRNKHRNLVTLNSLLLVGIRSWEVLACGKTPKCDLLFVYGHDVEFREKLLNDNRSGAELHLDFTRTVKNGLCVGGSSRGKQSSDAVTETLGRGHEDGFVFDADAGDDSNDDSSGSINIDDI